MTPVRRALPFFVAVLLGACVSLEEAPMAARPLTKENRLLLVVYGSPGPVLSETDSKAETAGKIVPGLGLVVKDMQDQRDLKASQDLQQYLPAFDEGGEFDKILRKQLGSLGVPSKLIAPDDAGLPAKAWRNLNAAADELDWQVKYYVQQPSEAGVSRNYSTFLQLDDVVVLEVNLLPTLDSEDEQVYAPGLKAVTKLLRANTMRQLWRHENIVSEPNAKRTLYEFKTKPDDLLFAWRRLMPMLGQQITDDLRKNLTAAGVGLDPRAGLALPGLPGAPGAGGPGAPLTLSGAGWAPAPLASAPQPGAAFTPKPSTP